MNKRGKRSCNVFKVDIPEHFQFRIVRSLKDMLLRKETEIHYIGGAEVLPPPLPAKEEMECIGQLVKEQSETARKKLIEHNLRLVVYIAKKFDNTGVGVEDLISIGTIGLIKAINTFNPEKISSLQPMPPDVLKMKF